MAAWSPTEPEPSPPRSTAHAAAPWEPEIAHPPSVQAVPEEPSPPPIDTHSPRSAPPPRSRGPLIAILAVAMIGALVLVIGALVALQSGDRSKASKSRDDDKAQEQDDRAQEQDGASPTPGAPCEGGSAARCTELGRAYQDGAQGRPVDLVKAAELYTEACSRDHTLGCYNLGKLYKEGQGVTLSYSRARDLFERVCQAGEMMGCNNLGTLYRDGQGVSQSASRAAELFSMACSRQNARACYNMAGMWKLQASYNGRGRGQNPGLYCMHGECDCRIFEHYRLACDYQYDKGCTRYRELVGDLGWCEGPSDW